MVKKNRAKPAPKAPAQHVRHKAATQDVLSEPTPNVRINPKWASQFRALADLRNHFLRQSGMLAQDASQEQPSYSEHMADAGTDSFDRDFALSMLSADQNALYEIQEAMRRIEVGTYGICELTGKPIQPSRLRAIPWTRFSLEAESQLEQRGAVTRARLGNLGSVTRALESEEEPEEEPPPETHG